MASGNTVLSAGFARGVITPPPGVALAGYFQPRYNRGLLDDLHVRVALFRGNDGTLGGIVQLDLLEAPVWLSEAIRQRLSARGHADLARGLLVCATHTHTGPEPRAARDARHQHALDFVLEQTVATVLTALERIVPVHVRAGTVINNPFAFNRRYWMKDGTVVTNPGKLNPEIDRPEGPVDKTVHFLLFEQFGHPAALLVNLSNHTDTIGGDLVSADWPGFLERTLQDFFGMQVPVLTLVAPSGNINHFDVTSNQDQTCYEEARRIGTGYAEIVWRALEQARPLPSPALRIEERMLHLKKRTISDREVAEARRLLRELPEEGGALTSEDLARGNPAVLRYFSEQLLKFAETEAGREEQYRVTALAFSDDTGLVSLPGEPFAEIGIAIRRSSPFPRTFVVSHGNGYAGYIVPDECFERGGYEQRPVCGGGMGPGSADGCIETGLAALRSVAGQS